MATQGISFLQADPNLNAQQAAIAQQQALAQALLQQGMTPIEQQGRQVGGVAYRISPLEGLAKMLQAYTGRQSLTDASQQQATLDAQKFNLYAQALRSTVPPEVSQPDTAGSGINLGGVTQPNAGASMDADTKGLYRQYLAASLLGNGDAAKAAYDAALARGSLTNEQKNWAAQRIDPAQLGPYTVASAAKGAMMDGRPNQSIYSIAPNGQPSLRAVAPSPEDNNQFTVGADGSVSAKPVPGSVPNRAAAAGATSGAQAAAKAPYDLVETYDPATNTPRKNYAGNVLPTPGNRIPAAVQGTRDAERLRILQQERQNPANSPLDNAALDREIARAGGVQSGPATGAPQQVGDMQKRFGALVESNTQAEPTISYLQNIKALAPKAATGQFSDRLQFVNSLLAPFSEKASDAVTATNLLDKYTNQIVSRLGQGGMGTDAARAILESAYPNRKMNVAAIYEAADNLIGAQKMLQAKTSLLSPHGNARDPVAYQQKEQAFDQAADPRLWQLKAMDAATAQKYLSTLPADVAAQLRQKAATLKQLGVF